MQYRDFGKTGIKISALGYGAMRLPEYEKDGKWFIDEDVAISALHRAYELGVNYFDTAHGYCHENSQYTLGRAINPFRDKIYLSTKIPLWDGVTKSSDYRRYLEEQLKRLDTDWIDFYHFHAVNQDKWDNKILKLNLLSEAEKAKSEGLIKHASFSFHGRPELMKEIIDTGVFSSVLCQYNLLDRANEDAIAYAAEKGLGVVIMGPVAGGRLAYPSEVFEKNIGEAAKSTPEIALRFVLGNPNVSCALSGMSTIEMVEQNAQIGSLENPLPKDVKEKVEIMLEQIKKMADLYCTGCEYCMPCPKGINIAHAFKLMNYHQVYGLTDYAKREFAKYGEEGKSAKTDACISCGACESKCPQNIKIRQQLKEVSKVLDV